MSAPAPDGEAGEVEREIDPEQVLRVRVGHGANCSSIGSVVDTLFATATIGAAVLASVIAALRTETVRVVARPDQEPEAGTPSPDDP